MFGSKNNNILLYFTKHEYFYHAVIVFFSIFLFTLLKYLGVLKGTTTLLGPVAIVFILGVGYKVRLKDQSTLFRILLSTILCLFIFYVAAHKPSVDIPANSNIYTSIILGPFRFIAILLGIIAFWRPAFSLILILYPSWQKHEITQITGIVISPTDYFVLIEFAVFMVLGAIVANNMARHLSRMPSLSWSEQQTNIRNNYWSYSQILALCALSIHLANYFYSAIAKIVIGDTPWEWLLSNNTHNIMMNAQIAGHVPLMLNDYVLSLAHKYVESMTPLSNLLVFAGQLFALISLRRVKWVIITTIFYDVMHFTIFLLTGIFFWKWIILNLSIIFALNKIKHKTFPLTISLSLALMLCASTIVFHVTWLGWFDTSSGTLSYFEAIDENNRSYRVPSNFFLSNSVTYAQQRIGKVPNRSASFPGHFTLEAFGSAYDSKTKSLGDHCGLSYNTKAQLGSSVYVQIASDSVAKHHDYVLNRADETGRYNYDLYPHHIWSMPFLYNDFNNLDLRTVTKYRLIVESVCLFSNDGKVTKSIIYKSHHDIHL